MDTNTSLKQLISNRFVQVILLSGLMLQIGIWVRNFSILLYVFDQTDGDPIAISLISVAEFLLMISSCLFIVAIIVISPILRMPITSASQIRQHQYNNEGAGNETDH
nr:hypothetical protein [Paenibacillus silvisoli]